MTRARNRRRSLLRGLGLLGAGALWAVACGGPQQLGGAGTVCFRADDCLAGFACAPEAMGSDRRVCSSDLSGIVSMVDGAPPDGEVPSAGAPAMAGAAGTAPVAGAATGGASGTTNGGAPAGGAVNGGAPAGGAVNGGAPAAGAPNGGAPAAGAPNGGAPTAGAPAAGAPAAGSAGAAVSGAGGA